MALQVQYKKTGTLVILCTLLFAISGPKKVSIFRVSWFCPHEGGERYEVYLLCTAPSPSGTKCIYFVPLSPPWWGQNHYKGRWKVWALYSPQFISSLLYRTIQKSTAICKVHKIRLRYIKIIHLLLVLQYGACLPWIETVVAWPQIRYNFISKISRVSCVSCSLIIFFFIIIWNSVRVFVPSQVPEIGRVIYCVTFTLAYAVRILNSCWFFVISSWRFMKRVGNTAGWDLAELVEI